MRYETFTVTRATSSEETEPVVSQDAADYRRHAVCSAADSELFYPASDTGDQLTEQSSAFRKIAHQAITLCEKCPVKVGCLADGLHEDFGIWGGQTARQRQELRRQGRRHGQRPAL